jgi:hypothetical protein
MNARALPLAPQQHVLTDDEAITLRRVAFGESELRTLRRADIDRLLILKYITRAGGEMVLTRAGRAHVESLPRSIFAAKPQRPDQ